VFRVHATIEMKLVLIARVCCVTAAVVWVLGLPVVALSSVPFSSDGSYFLLGLVIVLVGLAEAPIALAYPGPRGLLLGEIVPGLGIVTSLALVLSGFGLIAGAIGYLGDKAPSWVAGLAGLGLVGFFVWVVLASYVARDSESLGRSIYWLGILAGGSVLIPALFYTMVFFLNINFVSTNATIPFQLLSSVLVWLCLPIWLIVLAIRMPPSGAADPRQETGPDISVVTTGR
jgi:hypothetical protein